MTEFEITHGLSQDAPGPLEPVSAPTSHPIPTGATGEDGEALTRDRIEEIARQVYTVERFTKDDEVWHNLYWLTSFAKAIEKELRPAPAAGDALDWYERRRELEPGMIFRTAHGVVKLDRGVPGDGTKWYVLDWNGDGWSAYDDTVEPGDLIGAPVADHPIAIELARTAAIAQQSQRKEA